MRPSKFGYAMAHAVKLYRKYRSKSIPLIVRRNQHYCSSHATLTYPRSQMPNRTVAAKVWDPLYAIV